MSHTAPLESDRRPDRRRFPALASLIALIAGTSAGVILAQTPHAGRSRPDSSIPPLSAAPSDLPPSLALEAIVGGPSRAVASAPPHLFLGLGPRVLVLDVTDVEAPDELGSTAILPGTVVALAHDGDRLYAAVDVGGGAEHRLCVIDLAELAAPTVGGCASLLAFPEGLAVAGDHAFVASGAAGLDILDVSNPLLPQRAATFPTSSPARDVVLAGGRAFLAVDAVVYVVGGVPNTAHGVVMVDVTNPLSPVDAGIFNQTIPDSLQIVERLRVRGTRAYAIGAERASVYDISDPEDPLLLGQANLPRAAGARLALGDDELWLVHPPPAAGVTRVDLADPVEPRVTHLADAPAADVEWAGTVVGDALVAATGFGGYDVVMPLDPPEAAVTPGLAAIGQAADAVIDGERVLVAARRRGLAVVDAADPAAPRTLAGAGEPGRDAIAVAVHAGYAYLLTEGPPPADPQIEIYALPTVDDAAPELIGTRAAAAGARALAVHAGRLFVAGDDLEVLDLGDPAAPVHLDGIPLSAGVEALALLGDHAYLSGSTTSILPVDISDPTRLTERAAVAAQGGVAGLAAAGGDGGAGTLYVAYRGRGLALFDLAEPAAPAPAGAVPELGRLRDVALGAGRPWLVGPAHLISPDPAALADGSRSAGLDLPIEVTALAVTDATPGLAVAAGGGIALIRSLPGVEPTATHTPSPDPGPTTPAAPTPGDPTATSVGPTATPTPTPDGGASPGPTATSADPTATPTVEGRTAEPPTPTPEGTGPGPAFAVHLPWSAR